MAKDDVDIRVRLKEARKAEADARRVSKGIHGIGSASTRAGAAASLSSRGFRLGARSALGFGTAATAAGAAVAGLAFMVGKKSYQAFVESNKIQKDQKAALESTGAAAWTNAAALSAQAGALSQKTGIDDEAISKTQTLLLTFKGIRNEVGKGNDIYRQASQVTLDLSKRFGKDLNGSAILVGKALNDPAKGLSALQRIGVGFTEDQQKQVKALVATGDTLGAQKIILGELSAQTKGAAAATATNTDRLKTSWGNVEEAIGSGLYPVVQQAAGALNDLATDAEPIIGKTARDLSRILGDGLTGPNFRKALFVGKRDMAPLVEGVEREIGGLHLDQAIKRWHIDKKLEDAFVAATPRIADAVASSAPRVASSFANAFVNAGPGGQLLTVALLMSKLGAFPVAGRLAGAGFGSAFALSSRGAMVSGMALQGPALAGGMTGAIGAALSPAMIVLGAGLGASLAQSLIAQIPIASDIQKFFIEGEVPGSPSAVVNMLKNGDPTNLGITAAKALTGSPKKVGHGKLTASSGPSRPKGQLINHRGTPRSKARGFGLSADVPVVVQIDGRSIAEASASVSVKRKERGG